MANPPPGTPRKEWEEEYALHVMDMGAYMQNVEHPEQDTIVSLLAYHSWRWGHQVTRHRTHRAPDHWSPEKMANRSIVLHLTPEGSYILKHSGLPDAAPKTQPPPLAHPQKDRPGAAAPRKPPTAATVHMPPLITKHLLPHDHQPTNNTRGRRTLPLQQESPEGTFT